MVPRTQPGRSTAGAVVAAVLIAVCHASADVRVVQTNPPVPRGGVMLVSIAADPGSAPRTLDLRLDDGRTIEARVVRLAPAAAPLERFWTQDPRGLRIFDDPNEVEEGALFLLADVPADAHGSIRIGDQTLAPRWLDVPDRILPGAAAPDQTPLSLARADDRPDPDSPFEHWRWVLLADRLGLRAPTLERFTASEAMLARHGADLWRFGLRRLAEQSPGVAAECRDLLTRLGRDRGRPLAAWVADPAAVGALERLLLDPALDGDRLVREALAWADARKKLLIWPEATGGERVRLALANPTFDTVVAQCRWRRERVPLGVPLEPGEIVRTTVDRPRPARSSAPTPLERAIDILEVSAGDRTSYVTVPPGVRTARPPGVTFPAFLPRLTLAELQIGVRRVVPATFATRAELRRISGRWELFFECRRPAEAFAAAAGPLADIPSWQEVRGVEAVTIFLGPEGATDVILAIPETGTHRLFRGGGAGEELEVHRRSLDDRWHCRVVLPVRWMPVERPARIGLLRAHVGSPAIESSPDALGPTADAPSRLTIDLLQWDDLPRP